MQGNRSSADNNHAQQEYTNIITAHEMIIYEAKLITIFT